MNIAVVGLSHKTAALETRELISFPEETIGKSYGLLSECDSIRESLILSTCNRVEVYGSGPEPDAIVEDIRDFLYRVHGLKPGCLDANLYEKSGFNAIMHIFRVAGGLDSMVIGESQIMKQMQDACDMALGFGAAGENIKGLVAESISAGKKARRQTGIARGVTSISYAAVDLIKAERELEAKRIMVIGAGKAGAMTIAKLSAMKVKEILLLNRDVARAQDIRSRHNVSVMGLEALQAGVEGADIVVAATASASYLIDSGMVEKAISNSGKKMLLIDLGVPRNIEESVRSVAGARLFNIDDLGLVVDAAILGRQSEAERAEEMLRREAGSRYAGHEMACCGQEAVYGVL